MRTARRAARGWFWRSRRDAPPVVCEEQRDGSWLVLVENREVGRVGSREAAAAFAAKVDTVNNKESIE
jgi:hypothetical protein